MRSYDDMSFTHLLHVLFRVFTCFLLVFYVSFYMFFTCVYYEYHLNLSGIDDFYS